MAPDPRPTCGFGGRGVRTRETLAGLPAFEKSPGSMSLSGADGLDPHRAGRLGLTQICGEQGDRLRSGSPYGGQVEASRLRAPVTSASAAASSHRTASISTTARCAQSARNAAAASG